MKKLFVLFFGMLSFCIAMASVDLNTASLEQLETLHGIGPSKAQAIIDYRTKNGGFKKIEDIENVKGIGDKSFAKIKADLTVSSNSKPAQTNKSATKKRK